MGLRFHGHHAGHVEQPDEVPARFLLRLTLPADQEADRAPLAIVLAATASAAGSRRASTLASDQRSRGFSRGSAARSMAAARRRRTDEPPGSIVARARAAPRWPPAIVLCAGFGSQADELSADLLVRILRAQGLDARRIKGEDDLSTLALYGLSASDVQAVCLVGMTDRGAPEQGVASARKVRSVLPHAHSPGLLLPGMLERPQELAVRRNLDGRSPEAAGAVRQGLGRRRN